MNERFDEARERRLHYERVSRRTAYYKAIEPYRQQITKIYSLTVPSWIIYLDGRWETKYNFDENTTKWLEFLHGEIESLTVKYSEALNELGEIK